MKTENNPERRQRNWHAITLLLSGVFVFLLAIGIIVFGPGGINLGGLIGTGSTLICVGAIYFYHGKSK